MKIKVFILKEELSGILENSLNTPSVYFFTVPPEYSASDLVEILVEDSVIKRWNGQKNLLLG